MTTETLEDIIKRIGQTMQEGSFEEALGEIRRFGIDQSIQRAQGQMEQDNYQAAREAIAEAERYAFSDEEKSRVKEAKIPIYRKSIDGALYEAVTFMASEPVTPEHVRKAVECYQKAQEYARSIGENITPRIEDIVGFRYDSEREPYNFRRHSISNESLDVMDFIGTINQILEEMKTDFRIGPAYEESDNGAFSWREIVPYALGIYRRKMKAADPNSRSWCDAINDDSEKIVRNER